MYNETSIKNQYAAAQCGGQLFSGLDIQPPTVGENIDRQIESHRKAIARLEATRANLEKVNLLNIKINDLREVMSY